MLNIIKKKKIFLTISGTLVAISLILLFIWGLKLGIDFIGGSLLEVKFSKRPNVVETQDKIAELNLNNITIQPVGTSNMIFRFQNIDEKKHQQLLAKLKELDKNAEQMRFEAIGPSIGNELKHKSIYAILFVIIAIILYISWAFRKVSKPVESWKYGVIAIAALFHDVMITIGVFVIMGKFLNTEVNAPFVAAILTVLGYSVNDTIVVFDRIRENLPKSDEDFEGTVNTSINQTIYRSVYTSFTTLLTLLAVYFLGGSSIKDFALALSIGVFVGTYSSIFLASPLLTVWEKWDRRRLKN